MPDFNKAAGSLIIGVLCLGGLYMTIEKRG